jgi:long-chain fatty acid transport protein
LTLQAIDLQSVELQAINKVFILARIWLESLTMCYLRKILPITAAMAALTIVDTPSAFANGIDMNGIGARAMSMGGADVAYASDPLGAMGNNPAGLGFLTDPGLDLGAVGGIADGEFTKPGISSGGLNLHPEALPEGAFAIPVTKKITVGLSSAPTSALDGRWQYFDPPGGLTGTTTYGNQLQHSEILVIRNALGVGMAVNPKLSVGLSFGLDYNENVLQAPYIFQSQPKVKGAKTLLDLHTDGYGFDGQIGLLYKAKTNLQFGLTYQSESQVESRGTATGDAGVQFGVASLPFAYNAKVRNTFPESVDGGLSWGFAPQWRMALQVDWIDWRNAFRQLPVNLSDGTSAGVNAATGSSTIQDNVPLNWRDEFVYRGGLEYEVVQNLFLRAGYSYGASPVPDQTLTPLTAAITENTFTAGIGYHWHRYQFDLGYQYDLPVTQHVGTSGLLSGEYSNSSTSLSMHWLSLTVGATF